jgi:hypothetical protein
MATLYLTAAEQKVFQALPDGIRTGHTVETETLTFKDSAEQQKVRLRNMKFTDARLTSLESQAQNCKNPEEVAAIIKKIDFNTLPQDDMLELMFAMGPDVFTYLMAGAMKAAKTADDVVDLASMSTMRHGLLLSLSPSAFKA